MWIWFVWGFSFKPFRRLVRLASSMRYENEEKVKKRDENSIHVKNEQQNRSKLLIILLSINIMDRMNSFTYCWYENCHTKHIHFDCGCAAVAYVSALYSITHHCLTIYSIVFSSHLLVYSIRSTPSLFHFRLYS